MRTSLIIFFAIFALMQTPRAEAGGWGTTHQVTGYEGVQWEEVYYDMNGLHFVASLPNYSGTVLSNGVVTLKGVVENDGYVVITTLGKDFTPPKSAQSFVKMIQEANPDYVVTSVDAKKFGGKYVVDLMPIDTEAGDYWRFIATKDHLIQLGTSDKNDLRRLYFFEYLYIK